MSKVQYTIRIDENLYEKIKALAKIEFRSINNQFEYFLQKCMTDYENKNGEVEVDPYK
ncbi:MAG: TraY domain-containing protein [Defluviitaleaceae bacterium]|nr:TraY domain-containing protein [Defluviitaleaceae bacterium]MCL2836585.1 TraY domain-containing protein [Defluviitaleaceae bacterium]